MKVLPYHLLFWLLICLPLAAQTITENIYLIKPDGVSYLNYRSTRSSHKEYNLFLKKNEAPSKFLYINPEFDFDESDPERNVMKFKGGSYATMHEGSFASKISVDEDGVYTYINYLEERDGKPSNGHFGEWNTPENFSTYVCAWVFPENIEILSYKSNQEPENWLPLTNTLRWQGRDVNDIVFTIKYRFKEPAESNDEPVKSNLDLTTLRGNGHIGLTHSEEGVRLTLNNQSLFEGSAADLSDAGRELLMTVVDFLTKNDGHKVAIEGHTDNQPVSGALLEQYGSNWRLSSARSLAVVQFLQESGIAGSRLESHAFGEYRPVAENTTEDGRRKNRRTEIVLRPMS